MAIEQLGESLLSDIRTRRSKEEKRLRKQEKKDALMSLGINLGLKIGNEFLENKAVQFFNNKENLDNRIKQNSVFNQTQQDITNYDTYTENGFSYLYNKQLANVSEAIKLAAPAGTSPAQLSHLIHTETLKRAKEEEKALKARYDAAVSFYNTANGDPKAYDKALLSKQPKNVAQYITQGIGSLFTGGNTNALDQSHIDLLEERADAYIELRKTNPNPVAAFDLIEDYKDYAWKKATPKFDDPQEIKTVDDYGNAITVTAQLTRDAVSGRVLGAYTLTGEQIDLGSPAFNNTKPKIQSIPKERIDEVQMQVQDSVRKETVDTIANYTDKILVGKSEDKDRIAAAKKQAYGQILVGSKAIQKRFNLADDVAIQLAAEMEAINIQHKSVDTAGMFNPFEQIEIQPGRDLHLTSDVYSPMLALAAIEKLEQASSSGERLRLNNKTLANLKTMVLQETLSEEGRAELDVIFTNMSDASKKNYFDWMSQYKIFTAPMGQSEISLVDRFQQTYIPDMILEKDKERSYNARSYR